MKNRKALNYIKSVCTIVLGYGLLSVISNALLAGLSVIACGVVLVGFLGGVND